MVMRDPIKTIGHLIEKQNTTYISSIDEDGFPNTKAMLPPRIVEGIKTFYFSTNTSSRRVSQFRSNNKVCLYFCDRRFYRGVMLKGTIEVLENQEIKDKVWQEGDTMYYPKGVTDLDYCVLKIVITSGRYYCNGKSEDFDV